MSEVVFSAGRLAIDSLMQQLDLDFVDMKYPSSPAAVALADLAEVVAQNEHLWGEMRVLDAVEADFAAARRALHDPAFIRVPRAVLEHEATADEDECSWMTAGGMAIGLLREYGGSR